MSATIESGLVYGVAPKLRVHETRRAALTVLLLLLFLFGGFVLRATQLGAEGFSEDELNKLQATDEYRQHGLSSANGEHPMLMKAILTVSVVAAEHWNATSPAQNNVAWQISPEAALRLPVTLFGTFTVLLIFLLVSELFGVQVALIAAALWAFDPSAIGFNRIAKEDSFYLFFFLLANIFWLRGQRVAESGSGKPEPYYWATAAAFGAMLASKYLPHLLAVSCSYYYVFQAHPQTHWRVGKAKWLIFFGIISAAFLLCNPTILLPSTWHEMRVFAGEKRIGHDAYEFMGSLYRNQLTLWVKGSPWYFYYVFMAVKIPLVTLGGFLLGLPLLFRKKSGVGRFFILFWILFWFLPFSVMGGKFTRYFTLGLPVVLITAALGMDYAARHIREKFVSRFSLNGGAYAYALIVALCLFNSALAAYRFAPYYRLYTNALGGGWQRAGTYFPHDEFYDGAIPQTVAALVTLAPTGATIVSETPGLFKYYAERYGRGDLQSLSLSDKTLRDELRDDNFIVLANGRRYFSNAAIWQSLTTQSAPVTTIYSGQAAAVRIYRVSAAAFPQVSARKESNAGGTFLFSSR